MLIKCVIRFTILMQLPNAVKYLESWLDKWNHIIFKIFTWCISFYKSDVYYFAQ